MMVMAGEHLIGRLLLLIGKAGVQWLKCGKEAAALLRAKLAEALAQLQAFDRILRLVALAAQLLMELRHLLCVFTHRLRHLLELRRLRVGDLQLRLEIGNAAFDMARRIEVVMGGRLLLWRRCGGAGLRIGLGRAERAEPGTREGDSKGQRRNGGFAYRHGSSPWHSDEGGHEWPVVSLY